MKSIEATLVALSVGLALVTEGKAEDYYFYKGRKGELVISNEKPPLGSQIVKRIPVAARETVQAQETDEPQPNAEPKSAPKPSKEKQP